MLNKIHLQNVQKHESLELDFSKDLNVITGVSGTGKCLTGDTVIPCPITGKYRTILDMLSQSDWKVWSINKQNKTVIGTVNNIQINGIKDVYKLTLKNGNEIKSTQNHKFLTNLGWKELKDITLDEFIAVPKYIPFHVNKQTNISIEECRAIGYLIGDGSFTNHVTFTNAEYAIFKDMLKCFHKAFGDHHVTRRKIGKTTTLDFTKPIKEKNRNNGSSPIREVLKKYKLFNKKSTIKHIPDEFFQTDEKSIANLLAGLYLTDGYINTKRNHVEITSASKVLIKQIHHLLLKLKIDSYFLKQSKHYITNGIRSKKFISYNLIIQKKDSILNFYKTIPLIGIKKERLETLVKSKINDNQKHEAILPYNFKEVLRQECIDSLLTAKQINIISGMAIGQKAYIKKFQNIGIKKATCVFKAIKNSKIKKEILNDVQWIQVRSIEYVGKENTFDLDVKNYHNFIANDLISHNSSLFRGLMWCLNFSDISFNDIRREGSKETSVKIWLDNGFQIEKFRTDAINRYILSKEGCEDKVFDAVGKTLPKEIGQVLGMYEIEVDGQRINLNFASQDDLNFILDKNISPIFKAKLFGKLTGNEKIDIIFKDCNKDALRTSKELKEIEESLKTQEQELQQCVLSYKEMKSKLCSITEKYTKLQEDIKIYEVMKDLADKIKSNKEAQEFVAFKISQIKVVADDKIKELKQKAEELSYVKELTNKLSLVHNKIAENQCQIDKLKIVDVDFGVLKSDAQKLQQMKDLSNKINEVKKKQEANTEDMRRIEEVISAGEKELKETWAKTNGICPLCKGKKE
jgi:intein/homing endonuclease